MLAEGCPNIHELVVQYTRTRVMEYCPFCTTCSIRTTRTGREAMVYESYSWWTALSLEILGAYIQVHDLNKS